MTAPFDPSGRPSDRVESQPPATPEAWAPGTITGAESMVPGRVSPASATERQGRVSARRLTSTVRDLSPRDYSVLRDIDNYRFLQTRHVRQLHFTSHSTPGAAERSCRRVLQRLATQRLIEPLERRIGGVRAGSESFVWRLGPVGDRVLRGSDLAPRARRREPSLRFVDHTLAVADCYVTTVGLAQTKQLELIDGSPEPGSWRSFLGIGGTPDILKPDLCLTTAQGEYEDRWFIEVDRATESLPTIVSKCSQYERYRRTGREQADSGVFPWVVWVVPHQTRAERVTEAIRASRDLDRQLYRVVTADDFGALLAGGTS